MIYTLEVPDLTLNATIDFVKTLYQLPKAEGYSFDFKHANHFDPISLLYLSSEIQFCRDRNPNIPFRVTNYKKCSYAAHMGFFQAFGADYGNFPGGEPQSFTYLPITILDASEMRLNAMDRMQPVGEYIEHVVKGLTRILLQSDNTNTYGVLAYSLREIIRNVIEHSESELFALCAQYWPSIHKASLAIIDRGIGIRQSLSANPYLHLTTDLDALKQSIMPGISGKMYKGKKNNPYDHWQNSGYGLYMTSAICNKGGSFFIGSGTSGIEMQEDKMEVYDIYINGTILNLTIDTTQITRVEDMLMELSVNIKAKKGSLKPSKASTTISRKV